VVPPRASKNAIQKAISKTADEELLMSNHDERESQDQGSVRYDKVVHAVNPAEEKVQPAAV